MAALYPNPQVRLVAPCSVWPDCLLPVPAASAALHSNSHIMLAALKFFLGQDTQAEDEASDGEDEAQLKTVQPSKTDIYKANKKVGQGAHVAVAWRCSASGCRTGTRQHWLLSSATQKQA